MDLNATRRCLRAWCPPIDHDEDLTKTTSTRAAEVIMPWNAAIIDSEILAVHAALVPSGAQGEVVLFGGDEHWRDQQESAGGDKFKKTRLYDVATHALVGGVIDSPDSDVFCSHHSFAADGRLLIAGGTSKWPEGGDAHVHGLDFLGHRRCWLYNPHGRTWTEVAPLNTNPDQPDEQKSGGRWYPGCVTLGNGDVFTAFGHLMQKDFRHRNTLPERYNLGANSWISAPKEMAYPIEPKGGVRYLFFPRMCVLPDGNLFFATPMPVDYATATSGDGTYFSTRYNPATGDYIGHKIPEPGFGGYLDWSRPAVLLPLLPEENYRPRMLFCGETNAIRIDLGDASGEWQNTAGRAAAVAGRTRTYSNATLLPTGEVCLVGGMHNVGDTETTGNQEDPVLQAEVYSPGINWAAGTYTAGADSWSVKESAVHTRNYHSTALLLPNGKVWTAGGNVEGASGNPNSVGVKTIELYEPDYIAVAGRYQIVAAPRFASYGTLFQIALDRAAATVQRVALVRASSVTHSTDNDQRYVGLAITARSGNTVTVTAPPSGDVAPPGYYMLWVIEDNGNPCQLATFVRLAHVGCSVVTDRSTFSEEEIQSIGGGGLASIDNAVYVYLDGLLASELESAPTVALTWADTNLPVPAGDLSLQFMGTALSETDPPDPDVPQRVTYPFRARFNGVGAFAFPQVTRQVRMAFSFGSHTCTETLDLTKSPNPYMTDVDPARNNPHWLSTDVRVFATMSGTMKFGDIEQDSDDAAPYRFIKEVLDKFNAADENASHPFLTIDPDQRDSPLLLATGLPFGIKFYNYAVAKVRYRANVTVAQNVKVFFRMFNTVGTALEYNSGTMYKHNGPGPGTVPLLGSAGGEVVSIPFFLSKRVETVSGQPGAASMTTQLLDTDYEIVNISPEAGSEATIYFGCWLDINQTKKRFPLTPGTSDGPWSAASCRSIQELMRGKHQCLVAEVCFEPDATNPGETPGSSDNLSQRNVAVLFSDNPGGPDSHTIYHTLSLKPSSLPKLPPGAVLQAIPMGGNIGLATHSAVVKRMDPDQLLFRWHNLPDDSEVTLYFSDIDTAEVMRIAAHRLSPVAFTVVDKHTVRFKVADATWMPLPGGRAIHIPALLSVKLPNNVVYGQQFRVSIHQVSGVTHRVIGAFELTIPVSKAELILEDEIRTLSVMKHIATTIPISDHWYPIFQRYLHGLGTRVDALGGDAGSVYPNPDGSGNPYVPLPDKPRDRHCPEGWLTAIVLAVTLMIVGLLGFSTIGSVALIVGVIVISLTLSRWSRKCCGRMRCGAIDHLLLGSATALAILALLNVAGAPGALLGMMTAVSAVLTAVFAISSFAYGCRGGCCDNDPCCGHRASPAPVPPRVQRSARTWETMFSSVAQTSDGPTPPRPPAVPDAGHHH